jgi:hypothetical protein
VGEALGVGPRLPELAAARNSEDAIETSTLTAPQLDSPHWVTARGPRGRARVYTI